MAKTKRATFSAIDIFTADLSCLRAVLLLFLPTNTGSERARPGGGVGGSKISDRQRDKSPPHAKCWWHLFRFRRYPSLPLPCSVLDDVTAKNAVSKGKGRRGREHADDDDEDSAREGGEEMAVFPALYSASFPVEQGDPPRGLITRFVGVVKCQR